MTSCHDGTVFHHRIGGREMTEYQIQPLAWVVKPKGDTVDCESSTTIKRTHEGDGQFIELTQFDGKVRITLEEWPSIKQAVETAINEALADELHEMKESTPESEPEPTGAQLVGKECWFSFDGVRWDDYSCGGEPRYPPRTCNGFSENGYTWGGQGTWFRYAKLYREGVEP
jgi:hypothetical protein